jgi:hypothetical protein
MEPAGPSATGAAASAGRGAQAGEGGSSSSTFTLKSYTGGIVGRWLERPFMPASYRVLNPRPLKKRQRGPVLGARIKVRKYLVGLTARYVHFLPVLRP